MRRRPRWRLRRRRARFRVFEVRTWHRQNRLQPGRSPVLPTLQPAALSPAHASSRSKPSDAATRFGHHPGFSHRRHRRRHLPPAADRAPLAVWLLEAQGQAGKSIVFTAGAPPPKHQVGRWSMDSARGKIYSRAQWSAQCTARRLLPRGSRAWSSGVDRDVELEGPPRPTHVP